LNAGSHKLSRPGDVGSAARCRFCQQPLDSHQARLGDLCRAPACRHQAQLQAQRGARVQALETRRELALLQGTDERLSSAPVAWLRHHETRLVPVGDGERAEHAAALLAMAQQPDAHPARPELAAFAFDARQAPETDGLACSACRGRCCRAGRSLHGFIDATVLQRWQSAHGGTLVDAALHYSASVPAHHIEDSCLYADESGCVLAREERAAICNAWACDTLLRAREQVAQDAGKGVILAAADGAQVRAVQWLRLSASGALVASALPVLRSGDGDGGSESQSQLNSQSHSREAQGGTA